MTDNDKNVGNNYFVQAAEVQRASMTQRPQDDAYLAYAETDATVAAQLFSGSLVKQIVKTTNYFEQVNASVPLFAEMCKKAKFADHDGYFTLEVETAVTPDGKLVGFVEAGDDMYSLLKKLCIEWGDG